MSRDTLNYDVWYIFSNHYANSGHLAGSGDRVLGSGRCLWWSSFKGVRGAVRTCILPCVLHRTMGLSGRQGYSLDWRELYPKYHHASSRLRRILRQERYDCGCLQRLWQYRKLDRGFQFLASAIRLLLQLQNTCRILRRLSTSRACCERKGAEIGGCTPDSDYLSKWAQPGCCASQH